MMQTQSYITRRHQLQAYFDRTASETWGAADVGRAGEPHPRDRARGARRDAARRCFSWLPADMTGLTLLDAGCGTGALTTEAARRGARVTAIDVADSLVRVARERLPADVNPALVDFRTGDMLDEALGALRLRGGDGQPDPLPRARTWRVRSAASRGARSGRCSPPSPRARRRSR